MVYIVQITTNCESVPKMGHLEPSPLIIQDIKTRDRIPNCMSFCLMLLNQHQINEWGILLQQLIQHVSYPPPTSAAFSIVDLSLHFSLKTMGDIHYKAYQKAHDMGSLLLIQRNQSIPFIFLRTYYTFCTYHIFLNIIQTMN